MAVLTVVLSVLCLLEEACSRCCTACKLSGDGSIALGTAAGVLRELVVTVLLLMTASVASNTAAMCKTSVLQGCSH